TLICATGILKKSGAGRNRVLLLGRDGSLMRLNASPRRPDVFEIGLKVRFTLEHQHHSSANSFRRIAIDDGGGLLARHEELPAEVSRKLVLSDRGTSYTNQRRVVGLHGQILRANHHKWNFGQRLSATGRRFGLLCIL